MKHFTIRVMALREMRRTSQIEIKKIELTEDELTYIELGEVYQFYPLDAETKIELWIESSECQEVSEDN
jgi:RecB family endonuclease NucS